MGKLEKEDPRVQELIFKLRDRQIERLVDKEAADHVFSENFESRMDALIQEAGRKHRQRRLRQKAFRFASGLVASLMVAILIFVGPEKVAAVARTLQMTLVGSFSDHDEYYFDIRGDEDRVRHDFELPMYIPEGFELQDPYDYGEMAGAYYRNSEGDFFHYERIVPKNMTMGIDNEGITVEYKTIEGRQMMVHRKEGFISYFWSNEVYLYILQGTLSEDQFLMIIQGLPQI